MNHNTHKDNVMINHIRQTLNSHSQQVHDFDAQLQQLAEKAQHERQQRLQKHQYKKWWYLGGSIAVAASVMLIALSPIHLQQASQPQYNNTVVVSTTVEPQLLEDMDMLMVLGDEQ